jgi:hypothetical protein
MVTASDVQATSRALPVAAQRHWVAWALASAMVLPLIAPLLWSGLRLRLYSDTVLAAVSPTEAPWSIRDPLGVWALLLTVVWFALAYWRRHAPWWQILLVLAADAVALPRVGNVWLSALLLGVPLAAQLSRRAWPLALLGMAAAVALTVWAKPPALPQRAVEAARGANGPVFSDWRWSATFGSPNIDQASTEYWLDYLRVAQGHERWDEILRGYHLVVLDAADRERLGAELIRKAPDWQVLFDDAGVLVAARSAP